MSKPNYEFLGYVVRAEKCDIHLERRFDCEYEALIYARKKATFGFSVYLEKVMRAVNWQGRLLDNGDITSSNE